MPWVHQARSFNYLNHQAGRCHHMAAMWAARVCRGWGMERSVPAFANAFPLAADGVAPADVAEVYIENCGCNHAPAAPADLNNFINNAAGTHVATLGLGFLMHSIAFSRRGGTSYVYDPDTGVWGGGGTLADLAARSQHLSETLAGVLALGVLAGGQYRVHVVT